MVGFPRLQAREEVNRLDRHLDELKPTNQHKKHDEGTHLPAVRQPERSSVYTR
jgi:hypothetical protein